MKARNEAGRGLIWVCACCGKTSKTREPSGGGWDESCMLKAVLCSDEQIDGSWVAVGDKPSVEKVS